MILYRTQIQGKLGVFPHTHEKPLLWKHFFKPEALRDSSGSLPSGSGTLSLKWMKILFDWRLTRLHCYMKTNELNSHGGNFYSQQNGWSFIKQTDWT